MYERIEHHKRGKAQDRNQVANAALRLALFTKLQSALTVLLISAKQSVSTYNGSFSRIDELKIHR